MKVAVVGSGISGLACAHALTHMHGQQVTLFEAADYLGGHTNTVDVTVDGMTHPVDTGFLVFNHRTYPSLVRLFDELQVPTAKSEMSFSVSLGESLEWAGNNLATVFAQPKNLLRPRFLGMLADLMRFNRDATAAARDPGDDLTVGQYLARHRYGTAFRDWYLLPMAAAIWSCPKEAMLAYPFATFARFCHNHGLLQVTNRPQWYTVAGGGREYVRRIAAGLADVRVSTPVTRVRRTAASVLVETAGATPNVERFDLAVLATHSVDSLALLEAPSPNEAAILGAVRYQPNVAWLHTDPALLPRRRNVWAAWNYLGSAAGGTDGEEQPVAVSYLLNKLQPLPFKTPVMVTLNPQRPPADHHVLRRFEYAHPVFDQGAISAQGRLSCIQGADRIWFAGAWAGYGFHEDGLKAGLEAATCIGAFAAAPTRRAA
jgi:predicted NAD/FAD-binding protein